MARMPLEWDVESWMADQAVRSVGVAARGLWFDLLNVMHRSRTRGYLMHTDGRPYALPDIARVAGIRPDVASRLLDELEGARVFSRTPGGIIFNRRMAGETGTKASSSRAKPKTIDGRARSYQAEPPAALLNWIDWWNGLATRELVPHGVDRDRPSMAVCRGWARVQDSDELREILRQRPQLQQQIEDSDFCRARWFRFEKLFGARNRSGELICRVLLDGGYANDPRAEATATERAINGMLGIQAWQAVRTVLRNYGVEGWAKEMNERSIARCPPQVRAVAEAFGWRELAIGKRDVVRGQFLRLWSEVAAVWSEQWPNERLKIEAARRAAALKAGQGKLEAS